MGALWGVLGSWVKVYRMGRGVRWQSGTPELALELDPQAVSVRRYTQAVTALPGPLFCSSTIRLSQIAAGTLSGSSGQPVPSENTNESTRAKDRSPNHGQAQVPKQNQFSVPHTVFAPHVEPAMN